MIVPFADLGAQHRELKKEILFSIKEVISRGDFILGREVVLFEQEFAKFCGVNFAVGVSSGTAALFLALECLGIGEGDEVIVPDFTFIATGLAVSYTRARPVFVDIDKKTYNIDIEKMREAITKNTKAIIPVHLFGQPADMLKIMRIAKEHKLKVIEDAAQAHGASLKMEKGKWVKIGAIGDIGCFSFYPTKNLGGMGDAGMVVTNDEKIYNKLLVLRDCGRISKYEHAMIGYNSRLDTLQAAVLRCKLTKLTAWNKKRSKAASLYNKYLKNAEGIVTPYTAPDVEHIYHVYAVRSKNRDSLYKSLRDKDVGALVHYPIPLHLQKAYNSLGYKEGDFPVSERISKEIISLPIYPHITEKQIRYVSGIIKSAAKG